MAPLASGELTSPTDTHVPMAWGACASNAPDAIEAAIASPTHVPTRRAFTWLVAITVLVLDLIESEGHPVHLHTSKHS